MKRAFTLIELIFVILIIGVLATVAIPKFSNLTQQAKVNNLFKIINDFKSSASAAYVNLVDLEGKEWSSISIDQLAQVKGKNWHVGKIDGKNSWYWYGEDGVESNSIARIVLHNKVNYNNRKIEISVWCSRFSNQKSIDKCAKHTGLSASSLYKYTISW